MLLLLSISPSISHSVSTPPVKLPLFDYPIIHPSHYHLLLRVLLLTTLHLTLLSLNFFPCPPPSPPPSPPPLTQCYTSVSFFHFASIHLVVRHLSISHGLTYIFICVIVKTLLRCNHPDLQTSAWTAWQTFFIKKKLMNE